MATGAVWARNPSPPGPKPYRCLVLAAMLLYGLIGAALGAAAGYADSDREHEQAIIGTFIVGPFGIFGLMAAFQGQDCDQAVGSEKTCPDSSYFNAVDAALPLLAGAAAAVGAYYLVSEQVKARRHPKI